MKYYLTAQDLVQMQTLRTEFSRNILAKDFPVQVKNQLSLEFSSWLDKEAQSLYKFGSELPSEAATNAVTNNGNYPVII